MPAGHGRPFREVRRLIEANRARGPRAHRRVRAALADEPRTAVRDRARHVVGRGPADADDDQLGADGALCYLGHLERRGEVERLDGEEPERWQPATLDGGGARVQGCAARSAARIARVAGDRFSV